MLLHDANSLPEDIEHCRSTCKVVLPQLRVSDVRDVVEGSTHNCLVLELAAGCSLLQHSARWLCLPGPFCKLWRLRDTSRQLGSQPEAQRIKDRFNAFILKLGNV